MTFKEAIDFLDPLDYDTLMLPVVIQNEGVREIPMLGFSQREGKIKELNGYDFCSAIQEFAEDNGAEDDPLMWGNYHFGNIAISCGKIILYRK